MLYRISTGQILNHNYTYPVAPQPGDPYPPIQGLDPDLKIFMYYEPFEKPEVDQRIFTIQITHTITTDPHPEYSQFDQYRVTYVSVKRPDEVIKSNIDFRRNITNEEVFPEQDFRNDMVLALSAALEHQNPNQWTDEQEAAINRLIERGSKFNQNAINAKTKKDQVDLGQEPDIDDGWVIE